MILRRHYATLELAEYKVSLSASERAEISSDD